MGELNRSFIRLCKQVYCFSFYFRKPLVFDVKLLEILSPIVFLGILRRRLVLGKGWPVLAVFLFYVFLNFSFNAIYYGELFGLSDYFRYLYSVVAAIVLLNVYVDEADPYENISKWFIRIGLLVCVACVIGFVTRGGYFSYFVSVSESSWKPARAVGLDINPNYFSVYLMLLSSMVLAEIASKKSILLYFCYGIVLLGVASTLSRTVIVVQILIFIVLAKNVSIFKKVGAAIIVSVSLFFVALAGIGGAILERSENTFEGEGDIRFLLWRAALKNFIENPLFGVGLGRSDVVIGADTGYSLTTHNQYVEHLVQVGVIGFVLFFIFHFYILAQSWSTFKTFRRKSTLSLLIFFLSCLVFYMGNTASTSRVLWFAIGLFWIDQASLMRDSGKIKTLFYKVNLERG